jgi:hypothetical protein
MHYCHAESLLRRLHILVSKREFETALGVLSKAEQSLAQAGKEGKERMHEVHALYQRTRGDHCWAEAHKLLSSKRKTRGQFDDATGLLYKAHDLYEEYSSSQHFLQTKWKADDESELGHVAAVKEHAQDVQRMRNVDNILGYVKEAALKHGYEAIRVARIALKTFQMSLVKDLQKSAAVCLAWAGRDFDPKLEELTTEIYHARHMAKAVLSIQSSYRGNVARRSVHLNLAGMLLRGLAAGAGAGGAVDLDRAASNLSRIVQIVERISFHHAKVMNFKILQALGVKYDTVTRALQMMAPWLVTGGRGERKGEGKEMRGGLQVMGISSLTVKPTRAKPNRWLRAYGGGASASASTSDSTTGSTSTSTSTKESARMLACVLWLRLVTTLVHIRQYPGSSQPFKLNKILQICVRNSSHEMISCT